jgi:beta-hydroxylase
VLVRSLGRVRDHVLPLIEAPIDRMSLVGSGSFLPLDRFPWVTEVEAGFLDIRAELSAVLTERDKIPTFQSVLPSQRGLTTDERWRTFMFYGYGHRVAENCARCPRTDSLLQKIPGMSTAFFSILAPGKHIPPHRGFWKGVLRYHLGLIVPNQADRCWIRVGGEVRCWQEGGSLVFDDTFEHEVRNDTDEERVVLFVDFERPLPPAASTFNRGVIKLISNLPEIRRAAREQRPVD